MLNHVKVWPKGIHSEGILMAPLKAELLLDDEMTSLIPQRSKVKEIWRK